MPFDSWLLYFATLLAFMVTPGPSHLLMLSNSMSHGFKRSLATAAGDLSANALQMLAAGLGLAAFLVASQFAFEAVKWAGVAYLVWMAWRMWRRSASSNATPGAAKATSVRTLWLQGFITSAANPKAVVFFAALFPQFIATDLPFLPQFLALSLTYLIVDGLFLSSYGFSADWLAKRLKAKARRVLDRLGALCLLGAALMLGLKTLRDAR